MIGSSVVSRQGDDWIGQSTLSLEDLNATIRDEVERHRVSSTLSNPLTGIKHRHENRDASANAYGCGSPTAALRRNMRASNPALPSTTRAD
jgi:hypothetical protein